VIVHAHLIGTDGASPEADAVEVTGAAITRVGKSAELEAACSPPCVLVEAKGGFLAPGFHDAHGHFFTAAVEQAGLRVRSGPITAIQEDVRAWARAHPEDPWIVGNGFSTVDGMPARADLDAAEPSRPVALADYTGHVHWLNSAALRAAGITAATRAPRGGTIEHDASGEPTGILHDAAGALVAAKEPPMEVAAIRAHLAAADRMALAKGITGWESQLGLRVAQEAAEEAKRGAISARVLAWVPLSLSEANFAAYVAFGRSLPPGGTVQVVAAKGYVDGTLAARTAALLEPYADDPSTRGATSPTQAELDRDVARAHRAGLPVVLHAVGDRAVRSALDAFEHARASDGGRRFADRVEHVVVLDPADAPRFAALGVAAAVHPLWLALPKDHQHFMQLDRVGPDRAARVYPLGTLVRAGARVVFGSDVPSSYLFDPVTGLRIATTRRMRDGTPFLPGEAIGVEEAFAASTSAALEHYGRMDLGRIQPGQQADLALWRSDPRSAESVEAAGLEAVWVAGVAVKR
jgi:predicted amidohydrolase YtcJ